MLGSLSGLTPAAESLGPTAVAPTHPSSPGFPAKPTPTVPTSMPFFIVLPADRSSSHAARDSVLAALSRVGVEDSVTSAAASPLCCVVSPFALTGLTPGLFPQVRLAESRLGPVVRSLPRAAPTEAAPRPGH